jgi:transposase
VSRYDERGEIDWHPVFLDFALYFGLKPRLYRPYRAQTRSKVELGVNYTRRNSLCVDCKEGEPFCAGMATESR